VNQFAPHGGYMKINDIFEDDVRAKTERVRLTVSVPVNALAVYRRMADVSGVSVGRSIGDWLSDTVEGAEAMVELIEMAKAQPLKAAAQVHAAAVKANSLTFELMQKLSSDDVDHSADGGVRRGSRCAQPDAEGSTDSEGVGGAFGGDTPPYSNTGGKGSKPSRKTKK